MPRGGKRGELNYREPGRNFGINRPTMIGGEGRLEVVSTVSKNTTVDIRETVTRVLGVAEQESEGGKLVKVDEIRAEGVQDDHRNLVLISHGEGVADQAVSYLKTLRVEKDKEKRESSAECMEIRGREGEKDSENLEIQLSQLSDRPSLRELDVNVSTKGVKQQENVGKAKQRM